MSRTIAWLPTTAAASPSSPTIAGILSPSSPTIAGTLSSSSPTTAAISSPSSPDAAVSTSTASSPASAAALSPPPAAASPSSSSSPDTAVTPSSSSSSSGTLSSDTPSPRSVLPLRVNVTCLDDLRQAVARYPDTRGVTVQVTSVDRLDTVFQFILLVEFRSSLGWACAGDGMERPRDLRRVSDALRVLHYLLTNAIDNDLAFTEFDVECIRNELDELSEAESLGHMIHEMVVKVNDVLVIGRALTQREEYNELSALRALAAWEESSAAKVLAEQEDESDDLYVLKALADPGINIGGDERYRSDLVFPRESVLKTS